LIKVNNEGEITFNEVESKRLVEAIQYAKKVGLDTLLCLSHFTLPSTLKNGWENSESPKVFVDFTKGLLQRLSKDNALPSSILTINEPMVMLSGGYLAGIMPPHKFGLGAFTAFNNSIEAHVKVFKLIKSLYPNIQVGITDNLPEYQPYENNLIDKTLAKALNQISTIWIKKIIRKSISEGKFLFDWIGLQYYTRFTIGLNKSTIPINSENIGVPGDKETFINGWGIYPEGMISQIIRINQMIMKAGIKINKDKLPPLKITESGIPTAVDPLPYLETLAKAISIAQNITLQPIDQWSLWTLFDNVEWSAGVYPPFGIFHEKEGERIITKPKSLELKRDLNLKDENLQYILQEQLKSLKNYHNWYNKTFPKNIDKIDHIQTTIRNIEELIYK
jgi:beta-glucosidase/6-phospho-beta-glucosidase/beta-galactosidase